MREGEAVAVGRLLRLEGLRSYPLGTPHAHEVTVDRATPAGNDGLFVPVVGGRFGRGRFDDVRGDDR